MYQVRNRYYDASLSVWISRDPIGYEAEDLNLYRYVSNSPVQSVDPSGLAEWRRVTRTYTITKFEGGVPKIVSYPDWGKGNKDKDKVIKLTQEARDNLKSFVEISYDPCPCGYIPLPNLNPFNAKTTTLKGEGALTVYAVYTGGKVILAGKGDPRVDVDGRGVIIFNAKYEVKIKTESGPCLKVTIGS